MEPERNVMKAAIFAFAALGFFWPQAELHAGQLNAGFSYILSARSDMPGGPGLWARLSLAPASFVRVEAKFGREWGRASQTEFMCSSYWPESSNCVQEEVERRNAVSGVEGTVVLVSPAFAKVRVGLGGGLASYRFEVSRVGKDSGRMEWPATREGHPGIAPTAVALIEYAPPALPLLAVELRAQVTAFDFGSCIMDTWALCGSERFGRISVGTGYRF